MIWLLPCPRLDQLDTHCGVFVAVMLETTWPELRPPHAADSVYSDGATALEDSGVVVGGSGVRGCRSGVGEGVGVSLVSSSPMLKTGVPLGSFMRPSTR